MKLLNNENRLFEPVSLFLFSMTNLDFTDESRKHEKRVQRLGLHKQRTVAMLNFLEYEAKHKLSASQLRRYRFCHNYLLFRHFPELKQTKLHDARHCDIHLLCPLCAIRRAARAVMRYEEKCLELIRCYPSLHLYYAVLTVKNTEDLTVGFSHLESSMRLLLKRRREAASYVGGKKQLAYAANSVFVGVAAGAYSFEFKRGQRSGLWHPHVNLLLLADKPISQSAITDEWFGITKDSYITHCEKARDTRQSFVEIFKYALKFSAMTFDDTYHAWEVLRTRRLCGSFGSFRGLDVTIVDDESDDVALAYEELFYLFDGKHYAKTSRTPFTPPADPVIAPVLSSCPSDVVFDQICA